MTQTVVATGFNPAWEMSFKTTIKHLGSQLDFLLCRHVHKPNPNMLRECLIAQISAVPMGRNHRIFGLWWGGTLAFQGFQHYSRLPSPWACWKQRCCGKGWSWRSSRLRWGIWLNGLRRICGSKWKSIGIIEIGNISN